MWNLPLISSMLRFKSQELWEQAGDRRRKCELEDGPAEGQFLLENERFSHRK